MSWLDPPLSAVRAVVARALAEDLGALGDLTAGLLPPGVAGSAVLSARAPGVLAGRLASTVAFSAVDPAIEVRWAAADGDRVVPDVAVARLSGPLGSILTAERTALNLLCHLSGVATLTARFVDAAAGRCAIRDTRKTTPGLRALEKAAVRAGGGVNHRGSLSEGILVKDNHRLHGSGPGGPGISGLVALARRRWPGHGVEVECDDLEQVDEALAAGADMVLVDNMAPEQVAAAVRRVAGRVPVEVSGGVGLADVAAYAAAGADLIAVGALTHSAPVLDIGLDAWPGPVPLGV
ncbi:MAG: carboxylating nicotinate-nucleotide diphosphorylase [Acidimicrobiales bacterium]